MRIGKNEEKELEEWVVSKNVEIPRTLSMNLESFVTWSLMETTVNPWCLDLPNLSYPQYLLHNPLIHNLHLLALSVPLFHPE